MGIQVFSSRKSDILKSEIKIVNSPKSSKIEKSKTGSSKRSNLNAKSTTSLKSYSDLAQEKQLKSGISLKKIEITIE